MIEEKKKNHEVLEWIYTSAKDSRWEISQKGMPGSAPRNRLGRDTSKRLILFAIFLGSVGVVFGVFRIFGHIEKPFQYLFENAVANGDAPEVPIARLGGEADTDLDGLTDYEEKNIYFTSAFLEDTDSDGVSDFQEVKNNTDPTCIAGDRCFRLQGSAEEGEGAPSAAAPLPAMPTLKNAGITASSLREMLKNAGFDAQLLGEMSDEELMNEYEKSQAEGVASPSGGPEQNIENFTPAELRKFLENNGMPKELINSFSDEEIFTILKEAQSQ